MSLHKKLTNVLILFLSTVVYSNAADYRDAKNEDEALMMIAVEDLYSEEVRLTCGSVLPAKKNAIDGRFYFWYLDNEEEILAARRYFTRMRMADQKNIRNTVFKNFSASFGSLDTKDKEQFCLKYVISLQNGMNNIETKIPRASNYARENNRGYPQTTEQAKRDSYKKGCMKAGVNKGMEFDSLKASCDCARNVHFSELSKTEQVEYDLVARKRGKVLELPQAKRIAPLITECFAEAARNAGGT